MKHRNCVGGDAKNLLQYPLSQEEEKNQQKQNCTEYGV